MIDLSVFFSQHMKQSGRFVPARLQAALALIERLREHPSLVIGDHKKPNSSGLSSHETFGDAAHRRLDLKPINKNHGRRSCNVGGWGQDILDLFEQAGFGELPRDEQAAVIDGAQDSIAAILRAILDEDPLEARVKGRSAEAVIADLLKQAEGKGKSGDVAQYLVGAKLMLRLSIEIPVVQSNTRDRKFRFDTDARTGDYEIGDATIEIAVGMPDEKHLLQVAEALENSDLEVWLLTRRDRVTFWMNELNGIEGIDSRRVIVSAVESFIGQSISELGNFSIDGKIEQLKALFELYNDRWVAAVGTPGIRIVVK